MALDPTLLAWLGLVSAALSTVGYLPYLRDIVMGRTQPQRACWLIWSILGSIAVASQISEGAMASLGFAMVQVGGTILVFAMSIVCGVGRFTRPRDWFVLALAAVGLLLWALTSNAAYALGITITISLLGGSLTVVKAYQEPQSETLSTWITFWIASALAALAVGAWDAVLLAYPLYLLTLYTAILGAIALGRMRTRTACIPAE
ncbi:hypothetical protein [Gymnodinialimonas hymeniacidonis]|uniref:hypothetical protein n=1 Tax=Gymnodinialimonas hymeniacidonis TaxID=3126508 RepID=UPI0034C68419